MVNNKLDEILSIFKNLKINLIPIKSFLKALKGYLSVETYIRMGAFFLRKVVASKNYCV